MALPEFGDAVITMYLSGCLSSNRAYQLIKKRYPPSRDRNLLSLSALINQFCVISMGQTRLASPKWKCWFAIASFALTDNIELIYSHTLLIIVNNILLSHLAYLVYLYALRNFLDIPIVINWVPWAVPIKFGKQILQRQTHLRWVGNSPPFLKTEFKHLTRLVLDLLREYFWQRCVQLIFTSSS